MGPTPVPKVCLPVAGIPALLRAVQMYAACGIREQVVVVGDRADEVRKVLDGCAASISFAVQPEPRGSGDAARIGVDVLVRRGFDGDILLVAGDKVIDEGWLVGFLRAWQQGAYDALFAVGDVRCHPESGRVIRDEQGKVAGIVEVPDIARLRFLDALRQMSADSPVSFAAARHASNAFFSSAKKAGLVLAELSRACRGGDVLDRQAIDRLLGGGEAAAVVGRRRLPLPRLLEAEEANLSVYLFRKDALCRALSRLTPANAQAEEYLTDVVGIIAASGGRVETYRTVRDDEVLAFNTPEELARIEERLRGRPGCREKERKEC